MSFMDPNVMPFSGQPSYKLSPEQMTQRQKWMADEASRLIEARSSTVRPNPPVTIMGQTGSPSATPGSQDRPPNTDAIAAQLVARLAQRDGSPRGF
jgi:hypothetical protein